MADRALWQEDRDRVYVDNPPAPTVVTEWRSILWRILAMMTGLEGGATQGLWTCIWSTNGTVAGAGDNISNAGAYLDTNWVRNTEGNPHTSFVLQSPAALGGNGPYYLIVSLEGSSWGYAPIFCMSRTAPTGGTVSVRPKSGSGGALECRYAEGEARIGGNDLYNGTGNRGATNCLLSNEGDFVIFTHREASSLIRGCLFILAPVDLPPSFLYRTVMFSSADDSGLSALRPYQLSGPQFWRSRNPLDSAAFYDSPYAAAPSAMNGASIIFDAVPSTGLYVDGTGPLMRVLLWMKQSPFYGPFGYLPDLKWCAPSLNNKAVPFTPPYTGVHVAGLLMPFTQPLVY